LNGAVESIWRYPVKGFTPEPLDAVTLSPGEALPFDRLYAVENGPSGFDPSAPRHIPKQRFTVLARIPRVALIRTALDDASGRLRAEAPSRDPFEGELDDPAGALAFAAWLAAFLGEDVSGPLKVLRAPAAHRFMDDEEGQVSLINLASLGALEAAIGRRVDPLRLRGNIYIDGWTPWAEDALVGREFDLGSIRFRGIKTITRCVATHVDPTTGERDMDLVRGLFDAFGHAHCGVYAHVVRGGRLGRGVLAAPVD